jgi:flavin-binding protein dodecin
MAVGRVTEISATSTQNFDDAIRRGLARANQTLRMSNLHGSRSSKSRMEDGSITEYQVNMLVTFVLDD